MHLTAALIYHSKVRATLHDSEGKDFTFMSFQLFLFLTPQIALFAFFLLSLHDSKKESYTFAISERFDFWNLKAGLTM